MTDIIKAGWIQRHSKSFLEGGWKKVWVVLHRDSNLIFYKRQGDCDPKGSIFLKDVGKWFAVGQYTNGMPERPDIPASSRLEHLLAIPVKPSSKAKIIWFLFSNDNELSEWMSAIVSVLPPAPRKSEAPPPQQSYPQMPYAGAPPPPGYAAGPSYGMRRCPDFECHDYGYARREPSYGFPQAPYQQRSAYGQVPPPPPGYAAYPAQYPQQPYYGTQQPTVVHVEKKKSSGLGGIGEVALGVAGGALLAHGATSMMGGGGWGGGWGLGRWGSWSSLSSMSSFGSCGSFGSFGSWD